MHEKVVLNHDLALYKTKNRIDNLPIVLYNSVYKMKKWKKKEIIFLYNTYQMVKKKKKKFPNKIKRRVTL